MAKDQPITSSALGFPFSGPPLLPVNNKLFCELPDGTTLKWVSKKRRISYEKFPFELDDKSLRKKITEATSRMRTAKTEEAKTEAKKEFPKFFSMPSASEYKVLIADFDKLPKGIRTFSELHKKLQSAFSGEVVTRTPSNKVKIFFLVRYYYRDLHKYQATIPIPASDFFNLPTTVIAPAYGPWPAPPKMTHELAKEILTGIIKNNLYFWSGLHAKMLLTPGVIDLDNWSAIRTSSITEDICNKIKNLKNSFVYSWGIPFEHVESKSERKPRRKQLRRFKGAIPAFFVPLLKKGKIRDSHEKFLRVVLDSKQLAYPEGFDMPLTKIATACRKKPAQIAIWRRELEKAGFIKCIDESYERGSKAKTYVAIGELQSFLLELKGNVSIAPWPKTFDDGSWYRAGFRAMVRIVLSLKNKRDDYIREKVIAWIEGLEGLDSKLDRRDRLLGGLETIISNPRYLEAWRRG